MFKRLFITTVAAVGFAATAAAAHPGHHHDGPAATLPDFPSYAQPGECWARVPAGSAAHAGSRSQSVWTLEKGTGPGAVWSYSQKPAPGSAARVEALDWARVDCAGRQPFGMVHATPLPAAPPAPSVTDHPPALSYAPPMVRPHPAPAPMDLIPPPPPPMMHHGRHGPMHDMGPYAGGPGMMAPHPHGKGTAPPPPFFDAPPPPPQFTPRPVAPRWFGDRMLTWSGKGR